MESPIPYDIVDSNELLVSPREDEFDDLNPPDVFANGRSCNVAGCDKIFRNTSNLIRHMRTHTGVRPYLCNVCGKSFGRSFTLSRHIRIHTGATPYACDHPGCDKRFNTSGNLSRHKRIHSGEKPYACATDNCEKRFSTAWKLKRHEKEVHSGDKRYICAVKGCQKTFSSERTLSKHLRTHGESAVEEFRRSITRQSITINEGGVNMQHQYNNRIPILNSVPIIVPNTSQQNYQNNSFKMEPSTTSEMELFSNQGRTSNNGFRDASNDLYFQEERYLDERRTSLDYQPLDRNCLEDLQELWLLDPAQDPMMQHTEDFLENQRIEGSMSSYMLRTDKEDSNIEPLPLSSNTSSVVSSDQSQYLPESNEKNKKSIHEGNMKHHYHDNFSNSSTNQGDVCIPMSPRQLFQLARSFTSDIIV